MPPAFAAPCALPRRTAPSTSSLCAPRRRCAQRKLPSCALAAGAGNGSREELALLSLVAAGGDVGRGLSASERERIDVAAGVLEAKTAPLMYPGDLPQLDGYWTLLYTTELRSTPRRAVVIRQLYDTAERRVENSFTVAGPAGRTVEVTIGATFDVEAADTLLLTLVDIQLRAQLPFGDALRDLTPRIPLPSSDPGGPVAGALAAIRKALGRPAPPVISSDVRTTYLGQRLRISRSSGGELRVFCRPE